jgi:hypothetical protein
MAKRGHKVCRRCDTEKPYKDFPYYHSRVGATCTDCTNVQKRASRQKKKLTMSEAGRRGARRSHWRGAKFSDASLARAIESGFVPRGKSDGET